MTNRSGDFPSVSDICAHLKHLDYAISRRIRLYGQQFEVVSDPFAEADGIAVQVRTKKRLQHSRTADSSDSTSECQRAETPAASSRVDSAIVGQEAASVDKSRDHDRGKGTLK
jgi:hypothetical protein